MGILCGTITSSLTETDDWNLLRIVFEFGCSKEMGIVSWSGWQTGKRFRLTDKEDICIISNIDITVDLWHTDNKRTTNVISRRNQSTSSFYV